MKKKDSGRAMSGALGVSAAHRLDGGRVRSFPDRALRPGVIRGRRLEKQRPHTNT